MDKNPAERESHTQTFTAGERSRYDGKMAAAADPDERHHMTVLKRWALAGAAGSCSRQYQGDVFDDPPTPSSPRLVLGILKLEMRLKLLSPVTCHVRVGSERHQGLAAVERLDGDRQVQNRACQRAENCPLGDLAIPSFVMLSASP
jgi:hypothetical protein